MIKQLVSVLLCSSLLSSLRSMPRLMRAYEVNPTVKQEIGFNSAGENQVSPTANVITGVVNEKRDESTLYTQYTIDKGQFRGTYQIRVSDGLNVPVAGYAKCLAEYPDKPVSCNDQFPDKE